MKRHLYWNGWRSETGLCGHARGAGGEPPMNGHFVGPLYLGGGCGDLCRVCVRAIQQAAAEATRIIEEGRL